MRRLSLAGASWLLLGCTVIAVCACSPGPAPNTDRSKALPGVAAGEIVYEASDGSIHAVHADGSRDRLVSGLPVPLNKGDGPPEIIAWLPQRGVVAAIPVPAGWTYYNKPPPVLVDLARHKVMRLTTNAFQGRVGGLPPSAVTEAYFSKDGARLFYWRESGGYAADVQTGLERLIAPNGTVDNSWRRLVWPGAPDRVGRADVVAVSPNGRLVATWAGLAAGLSVVDLRTKRVTEVVPANRRVRWVRPAFSPDSSQLVFEGFGRGRDAGIWVVGVDARGLRRLAAGTAPAWWLGK